MILCVFCHAVISDFPFTQTDWSIKKRIKGRSLLSPLFPSLLSSLVFLCHFLALSGVQSLILCIVFSVSLSFCLSPSVSEVLISSSTFFYTYNYSVTSFSFFFSLYSDKGQMTCQLGGLIAQGQLSNC